MFGGRGRSEVLPLQNKKRGGGGGVEHVLVMFKVCVLGGGGHKHVWGSFNIIFFKHFIYPGKTSVHKDRSSLNRQRVYRSRFDSIHGYKVIVGECKS